MLVDELVVSHRPDLLESFIRHRSDCVVQSFDFLTAAVSIARAAHVSPPDIVVVDAVWLHLAELLHRILEVSGCADARIVIASSHLDEVFKAQSAHRGFTWQLDLAQPSDLIVRQLCELSAEAPRQDILQWNSIPLPAMVSSSSDTARDLIDREILDLVSVGMQDADIADVVHASTQTVKNRISAMLERSGYRNRTQLAWMRSNDAVAEAMIRGLAQRV